MKLNCIIDTCSCIYLNRVEFQQKTLLKHLHENVNINVSREVNLEVVDHSDLGLPKFVQNENLVIACRKYNMDEYERRMVGSVLPSRRIGGNKGEIDNFIVSIDQIHFRKKGAVIFITDDQNALNGNLDIWMDAFPSIRYWSSYDVILFLYAESIIPSKDIAVEMVKDVIAATAPKVADRSEKVTIKYTKLLAAYNQRIEHISKIFN